VRLARPTLLFVCVHTPADPGWPRFHALFRQPRLDELDEGDPFDGLGVATCPRDLTTTAAVGPRTRLAGSAPICGLVRMSA
jgi:hypothetical protein